MLVNHFLAKYNNLYNRAYSTIASENMRALVDFGWPGNVRQLENMIKQVVVRSDEEIIKELINSASHQVVPGELLRTPVVMVPVAAAETETESGEDFSLKGRVGKKVAEEEMRLISAVLDKTKWNRRKAADILQISYRSLLYKIKDYNLNVTK